MIRPVKIDLHPEVVKFLRNQSSIVMEDGSAMRCMTKAILELDGEFYQTQTNYSELLAKHKSVPPIYITTETTELWDAYSCKYNKDKVVLIHIPAGEKVKLYDCDPEVTDSQLVGVKWHTLGDTYVGFVDKDKIKKLTT